MDWLCQITWFYGAIEKKQNGVRGGGGGGERNEKKKILGNHNKRFFFFLTKNLISFVLILQNVSVFQIFGRM